jgi:hypothetical protein
MRREVMIGRPIGTAMPMRLFGGAAAVFAVFGLICAATTLWEMRDHGHSTAKIVAYCVIVWSLGWGALTMAVAKLGKRVRILPFSWRGVAVHVVAALGFAFVHHLWWVAMQVALRPYDGMGAQTFVEGLSGNLVDRAFLEGTLYFAVLGVTYAVDGQRRLREREIKAAQLEASLAQAKLTALELQLQPHFLFNTLHMIGGLVRQDRKADAVEMINGLGDLLRYSLDHLGKPTVTLDQELAIAQRYLEIQQLRFSDRMKVLIDVTPEARRMQLPAMLLQPLLENAVRHGIERTTGPSVIEVCARADRDRLALTVFNTGELGDVEAGIGMANTRARLHQLYGSRCSFELRGQPDGVVAEISLRAEA